MKTTLLPNGLSVRANKCLAAAGIPANKKAVRTALRTGLLFPFVRPTLYGKKTHAEVCRWVGLKQTFRSRTIPPGTLPWAVDNGLSFRANHCLARAGLPVDKQAVRQAIESGAFVPGQRPFNYGPATHAELCRWTGLDRAALRSPTGLPHVR